MTAESSASRHISQSGFESFLSRRVPFHIPIAGEPQLTLFIHPQVPEIGLRAPASPTFDARSSHRGVRLRTVHAQAIYNEVAIIDAERFKEGYTILCAIADRVQLDGEQLAPAVAMTLQNLRRLLDREDQLSHEAELGLFGELLILRAAATVHGATIAIQSWMGPRREEHDFRFAEFDLEVKATSSERRRHWITNLGQLQPSLQRNLWLISLQLTTSPAGRGETLPELASGLRSIFDGGDRILFDDNFESAGWQLERLSGLNRRWALRSECRAFIVEAGFPRLTTADLQAVGVPALRIPEVNYMVDLDSYVSAQAATEVIERMMEVVNG